MSWLHTHSVSPRNRISVRPQSKSPHDSAPLADTVWGDLIPCVLLHQPLWREGSSCTARRLPGRSWNPAYKAAFPSTVLAHTHGERREVCVYRETARESIYSGLLFLCAEQGVGNSFETRRLKSVSHLYICLTLYSERFPSTWWNMCRLASALALVEWVTERQRVGSHSN